MNYGATLDRLTTAQLLENYPHGPPSEFYSELERLDLVASLDRPIVDPDAGRACQAGLWLLHHYLDDSHVISQALQTPEGSWWHAIMHRLEGDYGNSKYWYRSVGSHPALQAFEAELSQCDHAPCQDIFDLVDACRTRGSDPQIAQACRLEWQTLFNHCFRTATGQ
ncbi:MAG: hypothetical protein MK108_17295 [Mariniblastus sp.]|nr:hypothetical protein [Mariniblastus sp.]